MHTNLLNLNILFKKNWLYYSFLSVLICFVPPMAGAQEYESLPDSDLVNTFFRALKLDDEKKIQSMLQSGLSPNIQTEEGFPAISYAMQNGSNRTVRLLLKLENLNVNQADLNGVTPLMVAASQNKPSWVASLLSKGAKTKETGSWTEVHYASAAGSVKALRMLLSTGADINAQSPNGTTPLMLAVRENQFDAVKLLLEFGADLNIVNQSGFDAAGYARMKNNPKIINSIQQKVLENEFEKESSAAA